MATLRRFGSPPVSDPAPAAPSPGAYTRVDPAFYQPKGWERQARDAAESVGPPIGAAGDATHDTVEGAYAEASRHYANSVGDTPVDPEANAADREAANAHLRNLVELRALTQLLEEADQALKAAQQARAEVRAHPFPWVALGWLVAGALGIAVVVGLALSASLRALGWPVPWLLVGGGLFGFGVAGALVSGAPTEPGDPLRIRGVPISQWTGGSLLLAAVMAGAVAMLPQRLLPLGLAFGALGGLLVGLLAFSAPAFRVQYQDFLRSRQEVRARRAAARAAHLRCSEIEARRRIVRALLDAYQSRLDARHQAKEATFHQRNALAGAARVGLADGFLRADTRLFGDAPRRARTRDELLEEYGDPKRRSLFRRPAGRDGERR